MRFLNYIIASQRSIVAMASLGAIAVGFWWAWRPLGLIVPGVIVFGSVAYTHISGR